MKEPTFDKDGYPTDETLDAIEKWDWHDLHGCFEFIRKAWKWEDWGWDSSEVDAEGYTVYRISTGGWSGNESLISSLNENIMIRNLTWYQSQRGGHYIFKVKELKSGNSSETTA